MPPMKVSAGSKAATSEKRKVVRTTIAFKKEIIAKYEGGVRVSDRAGEYSMAKSTISTILKKKEAVKSSDVAMGVSAISSFNVTFNIF